MFHKNGYATNITFPTETEYIHYILDEALLIDMCLLEDFANVRLALY